MSESSSVDGNADASHWLTRYDGNGDPYDTVCWCDIEADHHLDGSSA